MENENRQIVYNAIHCNVCNKTIVSYHRHDYKTCGCSNEAMVDGGWDYQRYGAKHMNLITSIVVFDDEPFEKVRQFAVRIHRESDGSFKPVTLENMDLEWLKAAILYENIELRRNDWHLKLLEKELEFRNEKIENNEI